MSTIEQDELFRRLSRPAHCDPCVTHPPGSCRYCDALPEWQALRVLWRINFTGENDPDKAPCPATRNRPVETIHKWPGNRPHKITGAELLDQLVELKAGLPPDGAA